MTRHLLPALMFLAAGCSLKPSWHAYAAGPISLEFPCAPEHSAAVTKCMMPDGATYALATVDKGITPHEELTQTQQYVSTEPKVTIFADQRFPVEWRENHQFRKLDSRLYYLDGKEYTVSVQFVTDQPPALEAAFFRTVKTPGSVPRQLSRSDVGAAPARAAKHG